MAGVAIGRGSCEHSTHVAAQAVNRDMRSGQRESCATMVENCGSPCNGVVANRAYLRKAGCHMVGIGGGVKVFEMAVDAVGGRSREFSADVALETIQRRVCAE